MVNSPRAGIGSIFAAPPPAEPAPTMSYAATETNYGGGFLEMLFRPPGMPQRQYQPAPQGAPMGNPNYQDADRLDPSAQASLGGSLGGAQGGINPRFLRQEVTYDGRERPGTIIINTRERMLYLVQPDGRAIRYGIGVGRPGFTWAGTHSISNMREWPDWRPPEQMLRRQPHLPRYMRGGPDNPLGARALYLGSTLYRIHGSNEPWTIGTQVSSGCIRMRNEDVIDLYGRVRVGTRVVVI
ncbi:MAG: L,D-transpeptidase family protein [Rhizobiales bacterium]|nr:L,D-transpeptidase family protein [Hyphomicrobiales bacterium]